MANFKLTQTKEQIQADLDLLDKNTATAGQVLTANGTGGASWQNVPAGKDGKNGKSLVYIVPDQTWTDNDGNLAANLNSEILITGVTIDDTWLIGDNAIIPYFNSTCAANRILGGEITYLDAASESVGIILKWFTN